RSVPAILIQPRRRFLPFETPVRRTRARRSSLPEAPSRPDRASASANPCRSPPARAARAFPAAPRPVSRPAGARSAPRGDLLPVAEAALLRSHDLVILVPLPRHQQAIARGEPLRSLAD